jgi:hypothetical protein
LRWQHMIAWGLVFDAAVLLTLLAFLVLAAS